MEYFLAAFFEHARVSGNEDVCEDRERETIIVCKERVLIPFTGLEVAKIHLGLEIIRKDGIPSPASGAMIEEFEELASTFPSIDDATVPNDNAWAFAWLLEEMRTKDTNKWSGTNCHPSYANSKLGAVLTTFAHFVYEWSKETIVLADIQSQ